MRSVAHSNCRLLLLLVSLAVVGCGDAKPPPAVSSPAMPPKATVEVVKVESLPEVSDPIPISGERPISVSLPAGWSPSRKKEYIFYARQKLDYPVMTITASPWPEMDSVTRANVHEFADAVKSKLTGQRIKDVTPTQIGDFVGVIYSESVQEGDNYFERQLLETVHGGFKYTLELKAREGTLSRSVAAAKAVAASIKFDPQTDPPATPGSTTPEGSPTPEPSKP